jgi:hypothetical protein
VYTPFSTNIRAGLKLSSFFEYSDQCVTNIQNALSQVWFVYKNGSCNVPEYDERKMIYYTSQVISTEGANSFYFCYLFTSSVESVVNKRLDTFVDFSDLYTSFLFNMLSNSLQIKTIATNINTYSDAFKWPELSGEIAKLIRITLDFESSNAAALNETEG